MKDLEHQESLAADLPFEPITLLIGLLRRWKLFAAVGLVSLLAALFLALQFGTRIYQAGTVLLFKGSEIKENSDQVYGLPLPLNTQVHLVKIPSNLEEVIERLKLDTTPSILGHACNVDVEKRTALVTIWARWDSAEKVASIVNTLRDVFLANQANLTRETFGKQIQDLQKRFEKLKGEHKAAGEKLDAFISANKIIDLQKETQWNLDQISSLQTRLSSARMEKDTLEAQKSVLQNRIAVIEKQNAEENALASNDQSLADLNIRIERLRRAIYDNREQRENEVVLDKYRLAYDRARKLYDKGLISKADLEETRANYQRQQVQTIDTEQIKEWKRQLGILEKEVVPPKENFQSPTQQFLQDIQLKALDLELQGLSLDQTIGHVQEEIKQVEARLQSLSDLQGRYSELNARVTALASQKTDVATQLANIKGMVELNDSDFLIIADAQVPHRAVKSNRRIIFAVTLVLGLMFGFTGILGLELLDTTVKTGAELQHKFDLPVLGAVPKQKNPQELFPDARHFPLIELFRIVSRHVRHEIPERGARVLITSAERWEGKTFVTTNLAACLGRQDERVLVMDAQVRSVPSQHDLRYLISEKEKALRGLTDYLTFAADTPDEIVWPTEFAGVECIPRMEEAAAPDLLASMRMKQLLNQLSERFSLILIDGPPMGGFVDAELVAQWCDAVILVVRSRFCSSSVLKDAVTRMKNSEVPVIGFIINDVDKLYMHRT